MQYKTFAEKEADNGEKIFKDFNYLRQFFAQD